MTEYLDNIPHGCKSFSDLASAFLYLAIFACEDKSEQKARIMLAYENGNFTADVAQKLIKTLGLKSS